MTPPAKASDPAARLREKRVFFFDGDGTLYLDGEPIPGAAEAVAWLKADGRRVCFLTNNSSKAKRDYVESLTRMGFPFAEDEVLTSTDLAVRHLRERKLAALYVLGTPALEAELRAEGFRLVGPTEPAEAVLVGFDLTLTYEKLARACRLALQGVPLVATHGDRVCPTREGPIPDVGAFLALIESATGVKATILGKPDPGMVLPHLAALGLTVEDAVMVGDRLYTDILLGNRAGMDTVCVLTGEATREEIAASDARPDLVLADLMEMLRMLRA